MADYIDQQFEKLDFTTGVTDGDSIMVDDAPEDERPAAPQQQQQQQGNPDQIAGKQTSVQRKVGEILPDLGKFVEENISIPLVDFIDNTFQGDQKTPEQISEERQAIRAQSRAKQEQIQQDLNANPLGEPIRVVTGAVTGVAESTLNAAELVGDLAKTAARVPVTTVFPGLKQVLGDDTQNPFSNKYEWALWDLGRNERGAQTGIGRIAQGFLEFGLVAAATGGFNGLANAGRLMSQGGLVSGASGFLRGALRPTAQGFGTMARAGAIGGLAGIPADLILATRGEGNLSNLIKENAPDWYPTWLTALAVDEDDSAAEAMFKTAFEGATLGFAADAVGAYLSGVRATRQALRAGMPEAEAAAFGAERLQAEVELTMPRPAEVETVVEAPVSPAEAAVRGTPSDPASQAAEATVEATEVAPASTTRPVFSQEDIERIRFQDAQDLALDDDLSRRLGSLPPQQQAQVALEVFSNAETARMGARRIGLGPAAQLWIDGFGVGARGSWVTSLPNGAELRWYFNVIEDYVTNRQAVDVIFGTDPGTTAETYGRYALTDFQRIARDMPEGTILRNFPASDGYSHTEPSAAALRRREQYELDFEQWIRGGREAWIRHSIATGAYQDANEALAAWTQLSPGRRESRVHLMADLGEYNVRPPAEPESQRARLYRRAGFGPRQTNGEQYAVVRGTPSGNRRWLEPIQNINDTAAVDALLASQQNPIQRAIDFAQLPTDAPREVALRQLREQSAAGIPITWDDVANAVPEYFTAGNRALQTIEEARIPVRFTQPQLNFLRRYANDGTNLLRTAELTRSQIESIIQRTTAQLESGENITANLRRSLEGMLERLNEGLAATPVDEAAAAAPRAAADMPPTFNEAVMRRLDTQEEFTTNPFTGQDPASGYAVAIDGEVLVGTDPDAIASFIARNEDVLSRDDVYIGAWINEAGDRVVELSRIVADEDEAKFLGSLFDQEAIYDINLQQSIPTYGKDQLRNTKGQHLAPVMGGSEPVMETPTVDSTTAAIQRLSANGENLDGAGRMQPTVTEAQLNLLSRATDDEEAINVLRTLVNENPVDLDTLTQVSRQTESEVLEEAGNAIGAALGAGGIDFDQIRRLELASDDVLLSRAGIVQVRGLMAELSQRLFDNAYETLRRGEAMIDQLPVLNQAVTDLRALMRIHKASAHAYGNLLKSFQLPIPGTADAAQRLTRLTTPEEIGQHIRNADRVLDDLVARMADGDPDARRELMQIIAGLRLSNGDPTLITNTVGRYIREIANGHLLDIMYNSILSGPRTHMVNTLSSAVNVTLRPITAFMGGDMRTKRAALASFHNFNTTVGEAWTMARQVMANNGRAINDGGKDMVRMAEVDAQMEVLRRTAEVSNDWKLNAGVFFLEQLHNIATFPLFDWPGKLMTTTDEFFKTMIARMEFNSRNMMQALEQADGNIDQSRVIFEELLRNNTARTFDPETGRILDPTLLDAAREVTFQTDLTGVAQQFGALVNAMPGNLGRLFFPFVKTGHNIAVYTASHVPLLNMALQEYRQVMRGDDEYLKAMWRGRVALGSMIMFSAGMAAHNGFITGNGPPNPNERKQWQAKYPPRSINVTKLSGGQIKGPNGEDKWVDYSRIEPFGQLISAVADLAEMASRAALEPEKVEYLSGYLTYAIAMNMTNKSYLQGLVPLGQLLTPGWQGLGQLSALPFHMANNYVPMSGARRAIANATTPYLQEFDNEFQRLSFQASFGLTKKAVTADWLTGEPIWNTTGGLFNNLSPLAVQHRGKDVVKDKLEQIGFDSQIVVKELSDVKFNREQRAYFLKALGESGVHEAIKKWVTKPNFDVAVADYKAYLENPDSTKPPRYKENEFWYREIVRIVRQYRKGALEQTMDKYPELRQDMYRNQQTKIDQMRSETPEAEYNLDTFVNPYLQ